MNMGKTSIYANSAAGLFLFTMFFCLLLGPPCFAELGDFDFRVETDHPNAIYKSGETMTFKIQLLKKGVPAVGYRLWWVRKGDDGKVRQGEWSSGTKPNVLTTSIDKPGFVYINVMVFGKDGKILEVNGTKLILSCGAGADPDKLKGVPEPEDFDEFWASQKAKLAKIPMNVRMVQVETENPEVVCFDIKLDCVGDIPVSGYFIKPKNATPKSHPIVATYHGAGVRSAEKRENYAMKGAIFLDINTHGLDNGRSDDYYKNLNMRQLMGRGSGGNDGPETSYHLGMYLRVLRSLEFMKSQPEWDQKNMFVYGPSQGGAQSIAAAGLDGDVTICAAEKPAVCDVGGASLGRINGIHRGGATSARRYFDSANMAKRIKAKTFVNLGLGDPTCPPSGIWVMYNNLACEKSMGMLQGEAHGGASFPQPGNPDKWVAFAYLKTILGKVKK